VVNILLVDDSEYIRNTLTAVLTYAGHNIIGEAANANEAIEKYQALHPDVVLLDIVLKINETERTGIDALREILLLDPQAKIIICSALNQQALIKESIRMGAKAFIAKPFQPENLLEVVKMCVDLHLKTETGKDSKKTLNDHRNAKVILA
jgi:two-component system chemotaxis response regulator CheY